MKTLKNFTKEIEIWEGWRNQYEEFVPLFIEEASKGKAWEDWDNEVFVEYFEKGGNQCVSSLQQGYFTRDEQESIKANWMEIVPFMQQISLSQNIPLFDVYYKIKEVIRKYTKVDRKAATNRLIAALQPNLLSTIVNETNISQFINLLNENIAECSIPVTGDWFKNSNNLWKFYIENLDSNSPYENVTLPWQTYELLLESRNTTNEMSEIKDIENESKKLLEYKKQIILQGPPGTGKTRLAKEIAKNIVKDEIITDSKIQSLISIGLQLQSPKGSAVYIVEQITGKKVALRRSNGTTAETSFEKIKEFYAGKIWEEDILDNDKRRAATIAKYIFDKNISTDNPQIKLVQFHPSYTYEDFVRGIIAESNGEKIEYRNINKTLGLFAKEALSNYKASKNNSPGSNIEVWVEENFEHFKNEIEAKLPEEETILSGEISIFDVADTHFKYAKKWKTPGYLKFSEFKKLLIAILNNEISLDSSQLDKEKFLHAHYRYTYYNALLKKFFADFKYDQKEIVVDEKNYILIIDEINRANLSSVLGELIYALEYRNEPVESMYKVEDSNKLVLPPNLYIIGTMNTADRSVGHIDYAIRRRFAFVDVPPENLKITQGLQEFDDQLFEKVAAIFDTNLSPEFKKEDVQLGHSYFIDKTEDGGTMDIRLQYEIKPILLEYVKDGILVGEMSDRVSVEDYINSLTTS